MTDLIKDANGDVKIEALDLVAGTSDIQHMEDLLLLEKGALKQFPAVGVGSAMFLEGEDEAGLLRETSLQYRADGMNVKAVKVKDGKIIVDASYQ